MPTHMKLLRGNPGKRPINRREPKPEGDLLRAPDWLTEEQKRDWAYAIAHSPAGLLKKIDRDAVAIYCVAMSTVVTCQEKLAVTGLVVVSRTRGAVTNPFVRIQRNAMLVALKAAAELGFMPASRSKIELQPDAAADDDWDEILDG